MRCPSLGELPSPPAGKTGWPWTEESEHLPNTRPDGSNWPKISIVTPTYGQGQFIEETIRSILLQGYPNIEYIIIDGGSKDNTVEIIKKYEKFIAYWISEPDRGQSHAINKGFAKATGQIYYWLNSDDYLQKDVFSLACKEFEDNQEVEALYGNSYYVDEKSELTSHGLTGQHYFTAPYTKETILITNVIAQPTAFWKASLWFRFGSVNESLQFIMDYELWLRWAVNGVKFKFCPGIVAYYRLHRNTKSSNIYLLNLKETINVKIGLKKARKLSQKEEQVIASSFNKACLRFYSELDFYHFWLFFRGYIRFTRRPPTLPALLRAFFALFGIKLNRYFINFWLRIKNMF